ncbi:MAG: ATP-grasp domain-containing protein [Acidobacteriota bacterium]
MPRVLLLLPTTTYRAADFLAAAERLGADVTVASEEPSAVTSLNPDGLLRLDFRDPEGSAARVAELSRRQPIDAVLGVDDDTSAAAAAIAAALGLAQNPPAAAAAARHKPTMRGLLADAGVGAPSFRVFDRREDPARFSADVRYPCVLKPTFLAASRGVIRADEPGAFEAAWRRIGRILDDPDVALRGGEAAGEILVEDFVAGLEVAVEGLLTGGRLQVLAIFDKPDPMEGPFFEETIYVTPSRLSEANQASIAGETERAARALGLTEGPVHAELRVHRRGITVIEIAARSIGGLCSRTLRFGTGMSLEEVILRHALRLPPGAARETAAAGVMMIPIRYSGRLARVTGLEAARAVPGIVEATITLRLGQEMVPLPEGWRYLGFLFSRGETPADAERSLRDAHAFLGFESEEGEKAPA